LQLFGCSDHYDLGVPILDVQVREFIAAATKLYHAVMEGQDPNSARVEIEGLAAIARFHFAMEEKMMERHAFDELEAHVRQHRHFQDVLKEYEEFASSGQTGRAKDAVTDMRTWLQNHIAKSDKAFADHIRELRAA
jgi:hemerythrin-like metal-binding protein